MDMISYRASAAAMVVSSALVSYAGYIGRVVSTHVHESGVIVRTATSTMSAATMLRPLRPRMISRNSRVVQPPVSGVPVAGATTPVSMSFYRCLELELTGWVQSVDI